MRMVPASRAGWAVLGVLAAALATFPLWQSPAADLLDRSLPDREYRAAAGRTSGPSPVGAALPLPETADGAAASDVTPAVALREVAALPSPSAVVDLPGPGPVLVTTLDGRVHELDLVTGETELVLDLSSLVSTGGERGLLGAAADPSGERLYLDYTDAGGDTEVRSWPIDGGRPSGDLADGVLHLRIGQPFANHNGGNLVFGPDGALWIGTGDGGSGGDPGDVAQDPGSLLGKMLRVVPLPEGGVEAPSTNSPWGGRPEVWGIGLRNPWRFSFDRETNDLWIADVGQDEVEEVSVVSPSQPRPDFGWDDVEGMTPFEGALADDQVHPVVTYGHDDGCSVIGGYVYRGDTIPSLRGWYLYGDYCGGWVRAVPADDPGREVVELAAALGPLISFAELDDGELLVLTADAILAVDAWVQPG